MCKFFSAIVTKTGELYYDKFNHSHQDLIELNNLREGIVSNNFIRLEYYSDNYDLSDLSSYKLHIDKFSIPNWFNDNLKENVINKLNAVIKPMILIDVNIDSLSN